MEISRVSNVGVNRPSMSLSGAPMNGGTPAAPSEERRETGGYLSPVVRYDHRARLSVVVYRDYETGETRDQLPSKRVVEEYRRAADHPGSLTGGRPAGAATSVNAAAVLLSGVASAPLPSFAMGEGRSGTADRAPAPPSGVAVSVTV